VLEARGHGDGEIRTKVVDISRTIHKLKGDAAALGLHNFEFIAHALEEELVTVKNTQQPLSGKALLPAITKLKDLFQELEQMQALTDKLGQGKTQELFPMEAPQQESGAEVVDNLEEPEAENGLAGILHNLSKTVSKRNDKRAHIATHGLALADLPEKLQEPVQSIAVQLVRNSIVHGALTPQERMQAGKTDYINIITSLTENDESYVLLVRDDGEGFNSDALLDRAIELEIITAEQRSQVGDENAFKLAFHSGFSSLSEANLDGGRGVGLDVVRAMVKEFDGAISVQHKHGLFCQFKIRIPKT